MKESIDPKNIYDNSRDMVGFKSREAASPALYADLGFKSGLEIHQQLLTRKKLFCRCPAGLYQQGDDYDAELIRHMRPTLSELGEYDGTALMEFKTKKNIIYRIKNETACTYDIDDTPPFPINREALAIAIEIALLLKTNVVGELHITRKQYLDGSIPTGFQRTAIVGIEGTIPLTGKTVRIIQLSIEEDSCREVSDIGHQRVYTTDRLGMPLIEMVTYPDMKTPAEAAEAGHYLRYLVRSTGKVRAGIGAARQDVNVSIDGGCRVEIKGVAHISWIPELTHIEAFRQKALLEITKELKNRIKDENGWKATSTAIDLNALSSDQDLIRTARAAGDCLTAVNLPDFAGILGFFTQPGKTFANELSDRLKVIACLERPNMTHSEAFENEATAVEFKLPVLTERDWAKVRKILNAEAGDAQIVFRGPVADVATALDTIEERCRLAFDGVPFETRKSFPDGTTVFERVLPGADRMYPDTDSAPIPIGDSEIEAIAGNLPVAIDERLKQLREWGVPEDTYSYLLKRNLVWIIEKITRDFDQPAKFVGTLFGHTLRHIESRVIPAAPFSYYTIYGLFKFLAGNGLDRLIVKEMIGELYAHPNMIFESVLTAIGFRKQSKKEILTYLPDLKKKFAEIKKSDRPGAQIDWIMGNLRKIAVGNIPLAELRAEVARGIEK